MAESTPSVHGLVLAGGAGMRFWPLSREMSPKQLLTIFGSESLIKQAIARLETRVPAERVHIVTNERLAEGLRDHLLGGDQSYSKIRYVIEPVGRNTLPAIALAAACIVKDDPDAVLVVLPSDHVVEQGEHWTETLDLAIDLAADGYLVTFGLKPTRPETGFGYIEVGDAIEGKDSRARLIARFSEKPDAEVAKRFVESGTHLWNSGMFAFRADAILAETAARLPEVAAMATELAGLPTSGLLTEEIRNRFGALPTISIDNGVMEHSDKGAVVHAELDWHDVGSFTALAELVEPDDRGNVVHGKAVSVDSQDSIIWADKRVVAALGLKDMVVVDTHDATLICPKDRCQDVRQVVEVLKSKGAEEALNHRTVQRPWGSYTVLETGPGFKIKMIEIKPKARLSEQIHHHRSEHWVVLSGAARVERDGKEILLHPNESTYIPVSTAHRLENPGIISLRLIEVQNGEYLEEDDLIRLSDEYERDKKPWD